MFPCRALPSGVRFRPCRSFPVASVYVPAKADFLFRLKTRSMRVRNSISSKIFRSSSSFGSSLFSSSMFNVMGTSILIVARNLENSIIFRLASTLVFKAPFSSAEWERRFSMLPYCAINFCAVFSPTPGQPGMLSELSPISPSISMTCAGDWISNFAFTSSMPITSKPPVCLGRYMKTFPPTS